MIQMGFMLKYQFMIKNTIPKKQAIRVRLLALFSVLNNEIIDQCDIIS